MTVNKPGPAGLYRGEDEMKAFWWGCAESFSGTGRPARVWAEATEAADIRPDGVRVVDGQPDMLTAPAIEDAPYPFNGMGGQVLTGPFATANEAEQAVMEMIETDERTGALYWK